MGGYRLVIDQRRVNQFVRPRPFTMERLQDFLRMLQPGDNLIKIDIQDGYYHLPLASASQQYHVPIDVYDIAVRKEPTANGSTHPVCLS